jgi:hypothetical protein
MAISLQLDEAQSQRLQELAHELQVDAGELARAAINDLVSRPAADFDQALQFVLEKNRELGPLRASSICPPPGCTRRQSTG